MLDLLKKYIFSNTSKDSSVLFTGTVISTILNLFIVVLLTRNLSTADFGVFITALTFTQLVTDMLELGINPATLNFLSGRGDDLSVVRTGLVLKIGVALLSGVLVYILSGLVASLVFQNSQITPFIQISALGVFLGMLISWGQSVFQAQRKFFLASIVNASPNVFRFLIILLLIIFGQRSSLHIFFFYQMILILSAVLILVRLGNLFKGEFRTISYQKFIGFGLPVGLSFMIAALYTRLDQIFIFNMAGSQEAGIYGLAARLTTVFIFLISSVNSAVVPRFASVSGEDFVSYFKKVTHVSFLISGLGLLAILFSPLIPLIFGVQKFEGSILPFQILMVGIIFFSLAFPYSSAILYRLKKTAFSFWLSALSLVAVWLLLNFLIPQYKSAGAALSVSLVYLIQFIISYFYFKFFLNEKAQ